MIIIATVEEYQDFFFSLAMIHSCQTEFGIVARLNASPVHYYQAARHRFPRIVA